MMDRKSVLMCVLTLLILAYVAVAVPFTHVMAAKAKITGLQIVLSDPDSRFVTAADIVRDCHLDHDSIEGMLRRNFDLYGLEARLASSDRIQSVNANILTDGTVRLQVQPMVPVARVSTRRAAPTTSTARARK